MAAERQQGGGNVTLSFLQRGMLTAISTCCGAAVPSAHVTVRRSPCPPLSADPASRKRERERERERQEKEGEGEWEVAAGG